MFKIRLWAPAFAGAFVCLTSSAQFASSVVSYTTGSGATAGYTDPTRAVGAPTTFIGYQDADPFNPPYQSSDLVSVGAGGSLTLQFNTPIQSDLGHPFGLDFIIFGHAGFMITNGDYSGGGITDGSFFTGGAVTTRVSVSADGITYYRLDPTRAPMVDGLFPTDASGNFLKPVNPALTASDFAGKNLAGIRALYAGSGGGAGLALSWAQDGGGNSVPLPSVDFVRVDVLSGSAFIDAISVVPEPSAWAVMGLGAAVLLLARRKTNPPQELLRPAIASLEWPCPEGTIENSPAFQRWVRGALQYKSRRDGRKAAASAIPMDSGVSALKRWAILIHPSRMKTSIPVAIGINVRAPDLLRLRRFAKGAVEPAEQT